MLKTVCALLVFVATTAFAATPADAEIRRILSERIDVRKEGVGIVVGVIDEHGRRIVAHGTFDTKNKRAVDGDTIFEIGSMTKVFTSLLLADAAQRGEVKLEDPAAKYLPPAVTLPQRGGKQITLADLATHTSALPRLPSNLTPADVANPYADYTVEQLYAFLATYELPRDIGTEYEYSNLGAGLLGHLLARRANSDYATLVRTRITTPLAMKSTFIDIPPNLKGRLATGHDETLKPVANWDLPTLAGAGALRSSANDLLTFLAAQLGYTRSPLTPAMTSMLRTRRPTGASNLTIALGWHIATSPNGGEIVWHNGGTGGYRSFFGFDPKTRSGVVVLSNTSTIAGVDDIGRHLLDPTSPLLAMPKQVAAKTELFDHFTGRYQLAPNFILTITREGGQLYLQATGQPRFEIYPKGDREFFLKVVEALVTFDPDVDGRAPSLVLHQNGQHLPGKRLEGDAPAAKVRNEVAVDAKILERYVGRYQLAPSFVIAITREGDSLFLQATAQPKFPLFAESENEFFLKAVDAQVTFEVDATGRAAALVLHQFGADQRAPRLER
ncbi:MAG TPA: serine hydrolase [Thermoanaerobaculia bacterium]|nr:serine hydrolase [Thermoanaerobaculia bacterium]